MAAGRKGQRTALNKNDIYGAKLIKEIDLLTKTEAIRWLKCRSCRNLHNLTLKEQKNKCSKFSSRFATLFHCCNFDVYLATKFTWPLSLLEFEKVLYVCGHKEFRCTSNMAGTRRYLWTQRVKCPNREDMRSKVSSRNWRKVYSMVRESRTAGRPLYN